MRKSPTGSRGFTLLELLLALSIGSIVVAAVYGTFHTAIKAKTRAEDVMTPLRSARYFFSAIKSDLQRIRADAHVVNLECAGETCGIPIRSGNVPMRAVYLLNSKKELVKELRQEAADSSKSGEVKQEVLGQHVEQLHFEQQVKPCQGMDAASVLISMNVSFACKPDPVRYHYAVLVEKTLLP